MNLRSSIITITTTFVAFVGTAHAADASAWRDRSIYQLLTDRIGRLDNSTTASCPPGFAGFCGGSYDMGFDAIWISPITEQVLDPSRAYHGYTQTNLYGTNSNFGTPDDLRQLSQALHDRQMYLMVDVVANDFGASGPADNKSEVNFSSIHPFNSSDYFHDVCWITINDFTANDNNVRICWLGDVQYPLPDVNTTQQDVRDVFNQWIKDIIGNYSIDADVYAVGEVADNRVEIVCPYQSNSSSKILDAVLNYPTYNAATQFFQNPHNVTANFLSTINSINSECGDPTLLGSFTENHDQPRFAYFNEDLALAKNVLTFTILTDGIPIVYAGQEQHYNGSIDDDREATWLSGYNEQTPLVQLIKWLNQIRRSAISAASAGAYSQSQAQYFYYDGHSIGFRKGPNGTQIVIAISNVGSGTGQAQLDLGTAHGYAEGTELVEVLSCETVTVGNAGDLRVALADGMPQVLYPSARSGGTGVCGR
ncbi:alpha-amylase [Rhizodiscina lignyota]|uniref:alpha-amylase n=1 Tax=Rhizodiscina lignyota TaxID=1504668 RepID=A0A9P4I455_9PEZI|nr:alpha-amylase [Rhizodiscina lignyota]